MVIKKPKIKQAIGKITRTNFWAYLGMLYMFSIVVEVLTSHGQLSKKPITWWDIAQFLLMLWVWSLFTLDISKWRNNR